MYKIYRNKKSNCNLTKLLWLFANNFTKRILYLVLSTECLIIDVNNIEWINIAG